MEFLCDPFASDDPNHTDTEPADEEDVQITQIENPDDRSRVRWNKYLQRLTNGAWGSSTLCSSYGQYVLCNHQCVYSYWSWMCC